MKKILLGFLFILASPIILLIVLVSIALIVPAPQCPLSQNVVLITSLDQKQKQLEKTGSITITDAEATQALNQNFSQNKQVENLRICFTPNQLNVSGKVHLGSFSPTFYLSTGINTQNGLQAQDTHITIGGLGFLSKFAGDMAQGVINNELQKAPIDSSYSVIFTQGEVEIKSNVAAKKKTSKH